MGGLFSNMFDVSIKETDVGIKTHFDSTVHSLAALMEEHSGHIVVITGAGISAGVLPTFRSNSNNGLWDVLKAPILSKSQFYKNPLPSWRLSANVRNLQVQGTLTKSIAHKIIHFLMKKGYINHLITQNVDSLHSFDDDEDRKVIELHGAINDSGECETCHALRPVDHLKILEEGKCPTCPVCGAILKPPVAFFEDIVPHHIRSEAFQAMNSCDVVILVGTHCTVDPVLSLAETAKKNGTIIVEINTETTQATPFVDISLRGTADEIFSKLAKEMFPQLTDTDSASFEKFFN